MWQRRPGRGGRRRREERRREERELRREGGGEEDMVIVRLWYGEVLVVLLKNKFMDLSKFVGDEEGTDICKELSCELAI